jgi:hypothetical protein
MFATDNGYYLQGGSGLYSPQQVELAAERADGNPCGTACDARKHSVIDTCDHCRGTCRCALYRELATDPATEK